MVELDGAPHVGRVDHPGVGLVDDVVRHLEVVEDALEEREARLDLDRDREHAADREEEPALQRREGDDRARGDRPTRMAAREHPATDEVHEGRGAAEEGADDREEGTSDHLLPDGQVGEAMILLPETGDLLRASAEHLGKQHP